MFAGIHVFTLFAMGSCCAGGIEDFKSDNSWSRRSVWKVKMLPATTAPDIAAVTASCARPGEVSQVVAESAHVDTGMMCVVK